MNLEEKEILITINKIFGSKESYFYSEYIHKQLVKPYGLSLINEIKQKSSKTSSEALLVLLASIRYLYNDIRAITLLEKNDLLENFVYKNRSELIELSLKGKVQGNALERGLPTLEILEKFLPGEHVSLIELGASYGLIGNCLLEPEKVLKNYLTYFAHGQQLPLKFNKIQTYLGIDLNPPDKDWLLACFSNVKDAERITNYTNDIGKNQNHKLLKASAIGFSSISELQKEHFRNNKIVVLTSFMLYQLNSDDKKILIEEINNYINTVNGHWICQEVELSNDSVIPEYYIDWDGERIITLADDKCSKWEWVKR